MNAVTASPSSSTALGERYESASASPAAEVVDHPTEATRENTARETTANSTHNPNPDEVLEHTPIRDNDGKVLSIDANNWKAGHPCYFVFTPICPSEALPGSCELDYMELEPNGPSHLFKDDQEKFWGLTKCLKTFITPKTQKEDIEQLQELVESACFELQEEWMKVYKAEKEQAHFCTIICPPCRCAIHDALIIANPKEDVWERKLEFTIKIDERIPTTCCPQHEKLNRLQSLANTLHEFDEGKLTSYKDAGNLKHVDLFYLEQRVRRLELDGYWGAHAKSEVDQVSELLQEQKQHDGNIIYMGEAKSCTWILESKPFSSSPRVPAAKEIFRLKRDAAGKQIDREFLGTFTCASSPVKEPARPIFKYRRATVHRGAQATRATTSEFGAEEAGIGCVDADQNLGDVNESKGESQGESDSEGESESESGESDESSDRGAKRQRFV